MKRSGREIKVSVLRVLAEADRPLGAEAIAERMEAAGLSPRTVRYHLLQLDREGLTRRVSRRRGRVITEAGRGRLAATDVVRRVGMLSARIDALAVTMRFDLAEGTGTVAVNTVTVGKGQLVRAMEDMRHVFVRRLGMGGRIAVAGEGEELAGVVVPRDQVRLGVLSSATLDGILLGLGVPVVARFGGLLEIREGRPVRFVETIDYGGTSLDPLALFIRAGLTRVRAGARSGNGVVGASFREFPAAGLERVLAARADLERHSLSGLLALGRPGQPLLDIPVAADRVGMVVAAGLNPVAAIHENGPLIGFQPMAGVVDYRRFHSFQEWRDRFAG